MIANLKTRKVLIQIFLFVILLILSFFPRAVELITHNFVFIVDQGRDYMAIHDLVQNHKITLIGSEIGGGYAGITGVFQGPFHYYLLSLFYILFHGNPYGGIVYMFIFGVASIVLSFYVAKTLLKNTWGGFIMSFLVLVSPPLIAQSRFEWNPYPSTFFVLLTLLFAYKMQEKHKIFIFLASFTAAFIYNFEIAITVPLLLSLLIYSVFIVRFKKPSEYINFFGGAFVAFIPMILFEVRHQFLAINGTIKYLSHPNSDKHYGLINNHLDTFLYNVWNTFPQQTIISSLILVSLFVVGLFFVIKTESDIKLKRFLFLLLTILLVTIIVCSFLRNTIFMYYLYHLNLIYIFIATYITISAFRRKQFILGLSFCLLIAFFLTLGIFQGIKTFQRDLTDAGGFVKIQGKKEAVDAIYQDAHNKPFGLAIFSPPVITPHYDYIFTWYGKEKYGYLPTQSRKGIFYLLIEKDPIQPWSYKGWLETVIKEGTILDTKTLKNGIIIQKRCGSDCLQK